LSQAANTFWDDAVERTRASARAGKAASPAVKVNPIARRRARVRRLTDGVILTIVLAAAATCVSVYSRARGELGAALAKHAAAGEKVRDLAISVEKLERDVQRLRSDSRVIESFARQKFGFVRSGEVVIKVSTERKERASNATDSRPVRVANFTAPSSDGYTAASN
jgi:cell division protein FtsB